MKRIRLLVIAEGNSDYRFLQTVLPVWLAQCGLDESMGARCELVGPDDAAPYLKISQIPRLAREARIQRLIQGESGLARQALQLVKHLTRGRDLQGAVLLRDTDDEPERAGAFLDARREVNTVPTAVGTPEQCIEAWYLCGVDAGRHGIAPVVSALKAECSFDPLQDPQRLSHKESAPRAVKKAAARLETHVATEDAFARLVAMSATPGGGGPLTKTRARAFFDDLRDQLWPLFDDQAT